MQFYFAVNYNSFGEYSIQLYVDTADELILGSIKVTQLGLFVNANDHDLLIQVSMATENNMKLWIKYDMMNSL